MLLSVLHMDAFPQGTLSTGKPLKDQHDACRRMAGTCSTRWHNVRRFLKPCAHHGVGARVLAVLLVARALPLAARLNRHHWRTTAPAKLVRLDGAKYS